MAVVSDCKTAVTATRSVMEPPPSAVVGTEFGAVYVAVVAPVDVIPPHAEPPAAQLSCHLTVVFVAPVTVAENC